MIGIDHTRQQFERRGFPRSIGTQEGDEFSLFDGQVNIANRMNLPVLPVEQPLDRRQNAFLFLINTVGFGQVFDFDGWHLRIIKR